MRYFYEVYHGSRTPLSIGHHFSYWNDGTYWKALERFIISVSKYSDVEFMNYQELMQFIKLKKQENENV